MKPRALATGLCTFLGFLITQPSLGQFGVPVPVPPPTTRIITPPTTPTTTSSIRPPDRSLPQQLPGLANALATEAQQLLDNLRFELYGTLEGGSSEMRAGAVLNAANQVARTPRGVPRGEGAVAGAMPQFDAAFTELNRVIHRSGGNSPRSSASVDRLQKVAFQIRNLIGAYGPSPGAHPPWADFRQSRSQVSLARSAA